ncbi:hypothetical protein GUITHDRAFT_44907, partial [Guillardia theta CCMP2712]
EDEDVKEKGMRIFSRKGLREQMDFMQKRVMQAGSLGWVLGAPGTGKSLTGLAFALSIDREVWGVSWMHISPYPAKAVQWIAARKTVYEAELQTTNDDFLYALLNGVDDDSQHVFVLDGFLQDSHKMLQHMLMRWREKKKENRRVLFISSMQTRYKVKWEDDQVWGVEVFLLESWRLEEYQEAVMDDLFYSSVERKLDANLSRGSVAQRSFSSNLSREDRILSKYYYAGGSSRYMFQMSSQQIIDDVSNTIKNVGFLETLSTKIGQYSGAAINRLFSIYKDQDKSEYTVFLSRYLTEKICVQTGCEQFTRSLVHFCTMYHPVAKGLMLEDLFFMVVHHQGLALHVRGEDAQEAWQAAPVVTCLIPLTKGVVESQSCDFWVRPPDFNHPGYDGVFLSRSRKLVRFVQVTAAKDHDLKLQYFKELIDNLVLVGFPVQRIEICFIVLRKDLECFKVSKVFGQGSLEQYGFAKGKERRSIRVMGV